jgi:hypothetical protein
MQKPRGRKVPAVEQGADGPGVIIAELGGKAVELC